MKNLVQKITALLVALFVHAPDAVAQSPVTCDSTILVQNQLAESINVRAALADWIPAGATTHLLFERPALINRQAVSRELVRAYPSYLRDRGIGGEVRFAILVDTTGAVAARRLTASSGHPQLDKAAETVISRLRFEPVRIEQGCAVPALLRTPVVFVSR